MSDGKEPPPYLKLSNKASSAQPHRLDHELPEAVRTLLEARTGDAVYVVGPDYTIVHWDQNMESLSGVLFERQLEAASRGLEMPTWPVFILPEES